MTGNIRFGTSSWSSKGWVGPFYPKGTKPADYLVCYAEHFDTVEVRAEFGFEKALDDRTGLALQLPLIHACSLRDLAT